MPAKLKRAEVLAGSRARLAAKAARRDDRERELADRIQALPERRYGVIYADPEWRFEPYSRKTGLDRAPENHYPTSELGAILSRPVSDIAAKDCVLFLWATSPMLPQALDVMKAWGFSYRTHCAWVKHKLGLGYWFRNRHELLLVGTRGKVPAPAPGKQWPSVIVAPAERHSQKPEEAIVMIENLFPRLPKIELNCRGAPRDGWDSWGNEAEQEDENGA